MASYITNRAPPHYAHPWTGNRIEGFPALESLLPNIPIPLSYLGEAIFGLKNRPWDHPTIVAILRILFDAAANNDNDELNDYIKYSNRSILLSVSNIVNFLTRNCTTLFNDVQELQRILHLDSLGSKDLLSSNNNNNV